MSNVGNIFDKDLVDIFTRQFPFYPVGFTLELSNGELVVVVNNSANPLRPLVRKMDGTDVDLSSDPRYRSVLIQGML